MIVGERLATYEIKAVYRASMQCGVRKLTFGKPMSGKDNDIVFRSPN